MAGFNENLSEKRIQRGLSQKAMAEAIGVAQSTYSLYEKGAREPNISKIVKISEVLNISLDDLFGTEPVVDEFISLLERLDEIDRAEISGTVKQMLKAEKYKEK